MTKEQFYNLLPQPSAVDYNNIEQLKDVLEQFPFFQTARLIYTKGLHDNKSFLYSEELKKTAIYAADRKVLYNLIHSSEQNNTQEIFVATANDFATEVVVEDYKEEEIFIIEEEEENIQQEATATFIEPEIIDEPVALNNIEENNLSIVKGDVAENKMGDVEQAFGELLLEQEKQEDVINEEEIEKVKTELSAAEILEQRLKELGVEKKEEPERFIYKASDEIKVDVIKEFIFDKHPEEENLTSFEYKPEEVFIPELKEEANPETVFTNTAIEEPAVVPNISEAHSFSDWLHQLKPLDGIEKKTPAQRETNTNVENLNAQPAIREELLKPIAANAKLDLIDRFIKTEPRIEANKTKFYSPANMAKSSIAEASDIVSETLANIYLKQGNLSKAIQTYEKLSLRFPEKKHFFAARIKEIREERI
jgi:hypothetical protein